MQQLLPWILASASLALLLGAGALWVLRDHRPRKPGLPAEWAVTARPVFNADERRIYRQLREALPQHTVLSKLPLVRFCQPTDPREVRYWFELLGSASVTFAVCSTNGRVLAAIDIDGDRASSRRTTQIKQSVLDACRVRYLRCPPDHVPSVPELQALVPAAETVTAARSARAPVASMRPSATARATLERTPLWQESGFMKDSFFGADTPGATGRSFAGSRQQPGPDSDLHDDIGGVVIDTPASPLRH